MSPAQRDGRRPARTGRARCGARVERAVCGSLTRPIFAFAAGRHLAEEGSWTCMARQCCRGQPLPCHPSLIVLHASISIERVPSRPRRRSAWRLPCRPLARRTIESRFACMSASCTLSTECRPQRRPQLEAPSGCTRPRPGRGPRRPCGKATPEVHDVLNSSRAFSRAAFIPLQFPWCPCRRRRGWGIAVLLRKASRFAYVFTMTTSRRSGLHAQACSMAVMAPGPCFPPW